MTARNPDELERITAIATSADDHPVLMLNLNCYSKAAGYPRGELYLEYMAVLEAMLDSVGAKVLWRTPVFGQPVGVQPLDEILAVWYPSHQTFIDLPRAPGAERNYELRRLCIASAVIHRCVGEESFSLSP